MLKDKRIDAYIAKAAAFAQPILKRVREIVHEACPECEETLKWSSPTFTYKGKLMVGMAAFKEHCRIILWLGDRIPGANWADKVQTVGDLPSKRELTSQIKQSMKLIDGGAKVMQRGAAQKPPLEVPTYFMAALRKNKKALQKFEAFSPSHRREYIQWIIDAKREDTRARRVATAVEWIAEGKKRDWKYM